MNNINIKNNKSNKAIVISIDEKEILREIVKSEKANLKIFSLSNKEENTKYEKILKNLDNKLAAV